MVGMYREYFGLKENPFSIAPDPRYLYMSEGHREALAHLLYGINSSGGFVLLTGEVGAGKTTVCRLVIEQMPEDAEVAFILNPRLTVGELLAAICDEFGIAYPARETSVKVLVSAIYAFLLDVRGKGRRAILIIEEAQNVSADVLEQVRLLTNLETNEGKLLQIIMVGQPQLRDLLSRPELSQLSQRITARYHLRPLSKEDVPAYIEHRLSVAGLTRGRLFPRSILGLLFRLTGGVPRVINVVCDRALTGAFVEGKDEVDRKTLKTAAQEVLGDGTGARKRKLFYGAGIAAAVLLLLAAGAFAYHLYFAGSPGFGRPSVSPLAISQSTAAGPGAPTPKKSAFEGVTGSREAAFRALFAAWRITYDPKGGADLCKQARDRGLECLRGRDGLTGLREMNKPAVLTLKDQKGTEYYAAVTSLKGKAATITVGGEVRQVDMDAMALAWSGDYLVLCRPPLGFEGEIRPGTRGTLVSWLDREVAVALGGGTKPLGARVFDGRLEGRVKKFQRAVHLEDDGIVGLRTIIYLTRTGVDNGPKLDDGVGGR